MDRMNKLWIEHSYDAALFLRRENISIDAVELFKYEYLDVMGLYETSWMVYNFKDCEENKDRYGYPTQ